MNRRRALLIVMGLLLAVPPAVAQDGPVEPGVLLIMDASGSMGRVDDRGVRLMDGAQDALVDLVAALPEGIPIGLRVYGHRVPNTDKTNGCRDSELVVPVSPLDRDQMQAAIQSFDSRGFTPIGLSLQEAAQDLGGSGTIVLVSDGEDTCAPPDPCEVAAGLIQEGFSLRVETVGFFLEDDPAREQLRCIAESTGGSFREVGSIASLSSELGSIVQHAIPEVGNFHLPIAGGIDPASATPFRVAPSIGETADFIEAGFYESSLEAGETRWFSVEVGEGHGLFVTGAHASPVPDATPDERIEILILDPDLNDARRVSPVSGLNSVSLTESGADLEQGFSMLGASTFHEFAPYASRIAEGSHLSGLDEESYNSLWLQAMLAPKGDPAPGGTYYVGLDWETERTEGEMTLGWLAGVTVHPRQPLGQDYHTRGGGPSPDEAVTLKDVGRWEPFDPYEFPPGEYPPYRWFYSDTITAGETRWYYQPLEFDEALAVEATVVGDRTVTGQLDLEIYDEDGVALGHDYRSPGGFASTGRDATAGVSMAYTGDGELPPATEAGAWLAMTWTSPDPEPVEVRMIVDVTPRYGELTPEFAAPEAPPDEPAGEQESAVEADAGERSGADLVINLVGGGLIVVAGGAWWLRRRRRRLTG
ncbi:MAG: vWA domain-containing protein [Acidimicrobiia bacterium]